MTDCSHSKSCYQRTFTVVIAFFLILCIGFAFLFKYMFDQQTALRKELDSMKDVEVRQEEKVKLDLWSAQEQNLLSSKFKFDEDELVAKQWHKVNWETYGLQFFYPDEYTIAGDNDWFYIWPKRKDKDDTPIPVMSLRILDNPRNISLEQIVYQNFDRSVIRDIESRQVNNLDARTITFKEVVDEYATCDHVILKSDKVVLDLFLYECLEWEYFDEVVNTFTKL